MNIHRILTPAVIAAVVAEQTQINISQGANVWTLCTLTERATNPRRFIYFCKNQDTPEVIDDLLNNRMPTPAVVVVNQPKYVARDVATLADGAIFVRHALLFAGYKEYRVTLTATPGDQEDADHRLIFDMLLPKGTDVADVLDDETLDPIAELLEKAISKI